MHIICHLLTDEVTLENPKPEPIIGLATVASRGKSTPRRGERSTVLLKGWRRREGAFLAMNG